MAKILHTADLHLGAKMVGLPENKRKIRKEEQLHVIERLISVARENEVDLFLIAGDLFDSESVSPDLFDFVSNTFKNASDIRFLISPGNHDPYTYNSVYEKCKWPDNVYIFNSNQIEFVEFEDIRTRVYGAAFLNPSNDHSLLDGFSCLPYGGTNIVLLHGDYRTLESQYNSITVDHIRNSCADYVALGHVHLRSNVERFDSDNVSVAYCGTPEGHGFDEYGMKGVYVGDVSKGEANIKFVPTCQRQFVRIDVEVTPDLAVSEIVNSLANVGGYSANDIVRVEIKGEVSKEVRECFDDIEKDATEKLLEMCFWCKIVDSTSTKFSDDNAGGGYSEFSLMSIFKEKVTERLENARGNDEDIKIIKRAYEFGVKSLEGRKIDI